MLGIKEIDRSLEEKEERSRGKHYWERAGRKERGMKTFVGICQGQE